LSYEEQERSERQLFGWVFLATASEYNEVLGRTYATSVFLAHDALHSLVTLGRFSTFDPRAREMIMELTGLYLQLREIVAGLVHDVIQ